MQPELCRILDANLNRAAEGLRVVEDYLRFAIDRSDLCARYKALRHDLQAALAPWRPALRAARNVPGDAGAAITTDSESQRNSPLDVARASQSRAEQALRCLEEYLKVESPEAARRCERLRYEAYTCGQQWDGGRARQLLAAAQLCVLVDARQDAEQFGILVGELLEAGVDMIQLRDKRAGQQTLLRRGQLLRSLTADSECLMVINDAAAVARLAGADGVHVGQDDLPIAAARRAAAAALVGASTHDREQVAAACAAGADYLGCGPTFPSQTKSFDTFPGLEFLRVAAGQADRPAFAIGGINAANLTQVLDTGFRRVAVGHAVTEATHPGRAAAELKSMLVQVSR